ncbi:hypothetical protein C8J57DRAFT_1532771 [Mycena rebaudengoi]|nr:hypothetical protein C8J57DRAFT_1532771 [Mycena rebaudengoi]
MILVSDASQYIAQNGADALFVAYFKTNDPAVVKAKYDAIINDVGPADIYCEPFPAGRNVTCVGINAHLLGISTYARPGTISQLRVLYALSLPLLTLDRVPSAEAGTHDPSIICSGSKSLSAADALDNATTFNCFAREVFKNTQC